MSLNHLGAVLAAGRVAYGVGLLAAPATAVRPWIGSAADDPRTRVLTRAFGVRDMLLGVGGLAAAVRAPDRVSWWFAAQAASDTVDALVTAAETEALSNRTRAVVCGVAAGSAAVNWAVTAGALRQSG